jgi:hypothetical protein
VITALFAACGMTLPVFIIAAVLSLPKQFATVYLGYALYQAGGRACPRPSPPIPTADARTEQSKTGRAVQYTVIAVTALITILALRYIRMRQAAVREDVVYERRKRRQARLSGTAEPKRAPSPAALEDGTAAPLAPPAAYQAVPARGSEDAPAPPPTAGFVVR